MISSSSATALLKLIGELMVALWLLLIDLRGFLIRVAEFGFGFGTELVAGVDVEDLNDKFVGVSAVVWVVLDWVEGVAVVGVFREQVEEDENEADDIEFVANEDIEARIRRGCDLS